MKLVALSSSGIDFGITREVVCKREEVLLSTKAYRVDGSHYVCMDKLVGRGCSFLRFMTVVDLGGFSLLTTIAHILL